MSKIMLANVGRFSSNAEVLDYLSKLGQLVEIVKPAFGDEECDVIYVVRTKNRHVTIKCFRNEIPEIRCTRVLRTSLQGRRLIRFHYSQRAVDVWLAPERWFTKHQDSGTFWFEEEAAHKVRKAMAGLQELLEESEHCCQQEES